LNIITKEDKYPLSKMGDLSSRLDGCRIFSKLDLQKGYLQVPVAAKDIPKTAIITPFGLFEFLRMPGWRPCLMIADRTASSWRYFCAACRQTSVTNWWPRICRSLPL
jgi:hypothetical protein